MKRKKLLVLSGIIIIILTVITIYLQKTNRFKPLRTYHNVRQITASEGTKEDPHARARYNFAMLRDPKTDDIQRNIGTKEIAFVNKLAKETSKTHRPVTDEWISRGPYNIGGRTKALALDVKDENIILAGGVSSGMWRSTDGGSSWNKTTAPDQLHSVSCIAQNKAPGKEHIWYYGTGEWIRGGSASGPLGTDAYYRGDGIFKSVDGGNTWSQLESTLSGTASESDPFDFIWNIETFGDSGVYAATSSGLFKSTDEGESWDHYLDFGVNNHPIDTYPSTEIAITSGGTCYATVGGDGPDNGIYRSVEGDVWENISPVDWPDTTTRTVIGIAPSNENIVYFFTESANWTQQLRKYEDGTGWNDLTGGLPENAEMTTYGGNMLIIYVKPDDENTIYIGTVGLYRSTNGGQSFEAIGSFGDFHVDQQAIVFYPSDPTSMIVGNDGGLFKTSNNMAEPVFDPYGGYAIEWESLNNGYLTTQFYSVTVDHATQGSETIFGGMQDNSWMFTVSSDPQIPAVSIFPGATDGGFTAISDGGEYYYANQGATFIVWRHSFPDGVHQWTEITPTAALMGLWLSPFLLDPNDTNIMYLPSRGELWRNSDLNGIPHTFPPSPTDVNWSKLENVVVNYTISALGMSKAEPRRLYYASMYGELFRMDNPHEGQPDPVYITDEDIFLYRYIHCIAVDPTDANKVMIVLPNYGIISIYASEDGGDTWTPVSGNLEENTNGTGNGPSVRWVSILYVDDQPIYFAGTSAGLFSTTHLDGMNTIWVQEGSETIGNVVVDMIDVRQSDGFVVVGTHGNGVYCTYITDYPSGVEEVTYPETFELFSPYPNPFNASTTISFILPKPGFVELKIYNLLGKDIETVVSRQLQAGEHNVQWTAKGLSSGAYFIRIKYLDFVETKKVLLQK